MFRSLTIGLLGIVVNALFITSAWAYNSEYFTITNIATGGSCGKAITIKGTFSAPQICNVTNELVLADTDACSNLDEPAQLNYETNKKLLLAAFLAGKPVSVKYSNCVGTGSTFASVLGVYVCVDGTSCGQ